MIFLPVENQGEEGADDALGQLAKEEQCQWSHHLCSQIDVSQSFLEANLWQGACLLWLSESGSVLSRNAIS